MRWRAERWTLINARRLALQIASKPVQWMLDEQGVSAVAKQRVKDLNLL